MRNRVAAGALAVLAILPLDRAGAAEPARPEEGAKAIVYGGDQGNCLACHAMPTLADAEQPGNSGPPLIAMSARFPDKKVLRARIWDATASNPDTMMPPFGKHRILTDEQIDQVVEFIYGL
jgi:sulfur-oxidizing protein SoxX